MRIVSSHLCSCALVIASTVVIWTWVKRLCFFGGDVGRKDRQFSAFMSFLASFMGGNSYATEYVAIGLFGPCREVQLHIRSSIVLLSPIGAGD